MRRRSRYRQNPVNGPLLSGLPGFCCALPGGCCLVLILLCTPAVIISLLETLRHLV